MMIKVKVVFSSTGVAEVYSFSRVPCEGESVCSVDDEGEWKVIEVIHIMNADPTCQVVSRILVG